MRRESSRRRVRRGSLAVGLALLLTTQACQAREPVASPPAAGTVQCTTVPDRMAGEKPAIGLVVQFSIAADSAGAYSIRGQLYQDRGRGPVSYANERGSDMSRSALGEGRPTVVEAQRAGAMTVRLWFPGSEIHRRARRGEAWIDIQVSRQGSPLPRNAHELALQAPRRYRCRVANIDPVDFVARLPGQDVPPALPPPAGR